MDWLVSIDGNVVPGEEARISVLDNGFTFGDSVYETIRTYGGRPLAWQRHIRRLRFSAGRLGITIPLSDDELRRRLDDLLTRAGHPESYIRLIVSRGVGDISYHFDRVKGPTVVMAVRSFDPPPDRSYAEGVPVAFVSIRRNHPSALDPAIKSCNLLNNILAIREAQSKGGEEAVLLNHQGELAEGSSSNLFVVRGGSAATPPLDAGILPGITREIVFEVGARLGIPIREQRLLPADLTGADEAFLTSSTRDVLPICSVSGQPIGSGRAGPVTLRILEGFREYALEHST